MATKLLVTILAVRQLSCYFIPVSRQLSWKLNCVSHSNVLGEHLNSVECGNFLQSMTMLNDDISRKSREMNFWSGSTYAVTRTTCAGISNEKILLTATVTERGKQYPLAFEVPIPPQGSAKTSLACLAANLGDTAAAGGILALPIDEDYLLPLNMKLNNVPHPARLREYLYNIAADAVVDAVTNPDISDKSRMQLRVNFPEVSLRSIFLPC
jgi:hypothetical protein